MKKLIIANWKMNPATPAEAAELVARTEERLQELGQTGDRLDVALCPPFVFLEDVAGLLRQGSTAGAVALGAQDIALSDAGAQTGEVGGAQLEALGVRYVIIGHSERRWKLGEDDATVNAKLRIVLAHGMVPVVCIGERTRDAGWQAALAAQVDATFRGLQAAQVARCLIAYEPVWAISTNPGATPDTPASAVAAMGLVRERIASAWEASVACLYGGSVTATNAADFLSRPEIAGVLVGGASVRPEFADILRIAATLR